MKMSKNLAIAALAATALIGGTMPAWAYPTAVAGSHVANDAASDSTNLQRSGRGGAKAGGRSAGAARPAARPAGGQARAKPTRQAGTPHNVRSRSGANLNSTAHNRAGNVNRGGNVNRNANVNRNVNRNINRDMNVDVDVHNNWDNDWDWDDRDYHPIAAGVAMGATAAIVGSIVNSPPSTGCYTQIVNGISYTQCGNTWYQPQYAGTTVQYIVVNPPM